MRLDRVGSLYWLSHDILWTVAEVLSYRDADTIKVALRQVLHHATRLEVNKDIVSFLEEVLGEAEEMFNVDWTEDRREEFKRDLLQVRGDLAEIFTAADPDWEPWAPGNEHLAEQ